MIERAVELVEAASEALTLARADQQRALAELLAAIDRTRQHANSLRSLVIQQGKGGA